MFISARKYLIPLKLLLSVKTKIMFLKIKIMFFKETWQQRQAKEQAKK